MKAWARHHGQSLRGAILRFIRTPFATLLNAFAIALSLALPLGAYIAVFNLQTLGGHAEGSAPQLNVFLNTEGGTQARQTVEKLIRQSSAVRELRFIDRDTALADMKRDPALAEMVALLRTNPLPDAFVADLRPVDAASAEDLAALLRAHPQVAQVQLDTEWLQRLERLLDLGKLAVGLLGGLLALALVAVTFNTVRMQILTQRDEIEVSRLVGATGPYIRRPFYYQGALLGFLGGVLSLAIVLAAGALLNPHVAALAQSYGGEFRLSLPPPADLAALLSFATLLGWMGAWLSVSRHLQSVDPR